MNQDDFINRIIQKFKNIDCDNIEIWTEDYRAVLQEKTINYDKLYELLLREWGSSYYAPTTQWLIEHKKKCMPLPKNGDDVYRLPTSNVGPPSEDVLKKVNEIRKKVNNQKLLREQNRKVNYG